jgi:hypothetical protein
MSSEWWNVELVGKSWLRMSSLMKMLCSKNNECHKKVTTFYTFYNKNMYFCATFATFRRKVSIFGCPKPKSCLRRPNSCKPRGFFRINVGKKWNKYVFPPFQQHSLKKPPQKTRLSPKSLYNPGPKPY